MFSPILVCPVSLLFLGQRGKGMDLPRSLLNTATLFAGLTLLGCELLSLFSLYRFGPLLLYWSVVSLVVFFQQRKSILLGLKKFYPPRFGLHWAEAVCIAVLAACAIATFLAAILYPPTSNYDSMTYHLTRAFFWMKNGSVHLYPSVDARQLFVGSFAEFNVLQLMVLNRGSDVLSNLVQWGAYMGAMLAAASMAQLLGGSRKAQFATAVIVATAPLVVMEARTTQTDLFLSFWVLVTAYHIIWFVKNRPQSKQAVEWAVLAGLAGGAAVLTKLLALVALLPFGLFFVVDAVFGKRAQAGEIAENGAVLASTKKQKRNPFPTKTLVIVLSVVVAVALMFNLGFFVRNAVELDGDFLALRAEVGKATIGSFQPKYLLSALIMNSVYAFASSQQFISKGLTAFVNVCNRLLGVENADPIVFYAPTDYTASGIRFSHDAGTNPLHCALALAAFLILLWQWLRRRSGGAAFCTGMSFAQQRLF